MQTEGLHHPDGEDNGFGRVAFVIMKTPRHSNDGLIADSTKDQLALMALHGGNGKMRDLFVRDLVLYFYFLYKISQTASQDNPYFGACCMIALEKLAGFGYFIECIH